MRLLEDTLLECCEEGSVEIDLIFAVLDSESIYIYICIDLFVITNFSGRPRHLFDCEL